MADADVEARFLVEAQWQDKPFAYQMGEQSEQPSENGMYQKDDGFVQEIWRNPMRRRIIYDHCPEIKMILSIQ